MLAFLLLTCAALGGDLALDADPKVRAAYAAQLLEAEAAAGAREVAARGRVAALAALRERGDVGALAAVSDDAHLARLVRELAAAEREVAQLALTHGQAHPTRIASERGLIALRDEVEQASAAVVAGEGAQIEVARAEREALSAERERLAGR